MSSGLDVYGAFTVRRSVYPEAGTGSMAEVSYLALGLSSEVGEVTDIVKKAVRNGLPTLPEGDKEKLLDELGDLYFYVTRMVIALGFQPDDAIWSNVTKLIARSERGTIKNHGKDSVE